MNWVVETKSPEVSEMIQKLAFKAGYAWAYTAQNVDSCPSILCLSFYPAIKRLSSGNFDGLGINALFYSNFEKLTLDEAVNRLTKIAKPPKVGEYEVVLSDDKKSIKVGCQTISKELCLEIMKLFDESN